MDERTKVPFEAKGSSANSMTSGEYASAYYWKLEQLLDRVEQAITYYQVLNISRSATTEQISQAYRHLLAILAPTNSPVHLKMPSEMHQRIKQAIKEISQAGAILLNYGKRVEYDNSLSRRTTAPLSFNAVILPKLQCPPPEPPPLTSAENPLEKTEEKPKAQLTEMTRDPRTVTLENDVELQAIATQKPIGTTLAKEASLEERRRGPRFQLTIPVYVTGYDRKREKWHEIAKAVDVSRFGVGIQMRTRIPQGTVLHLTLPMPTKLRTHSFADNSYSVYAIVRRVAPPKNGLRIVGVELLGEHPPAGYLERPWGIFQTTTWLGANRRREPRQARSESVAIEYLNQYMKLVQTEFATTEDVSRSGLRVAVRNAPSDFDYVRVTYMANNDSAVAAVCNRFVGKDGVERLCLNLLNANGAR
ncbi:MAG: DnaJ domain-containing protein [Acidobacteria bacterium]|nr:DnaJ domain-containing protein [Acidobacteriota bacterium]